MIPDKTKFTDAEPGDGGNNSFAEECATPSVVVRPLQSEDPGSVLISSPTTTDSVCQEKDVKTSFYVESVMEV